MESPNIITNESLASALEITHRARSQCLKLLEISRLRDQSPSEEAAQSIMNEILIEQKLLNSYLAHLRGLNRIAVHEVRHTKQDTAEARTEIDTLHLQLQNLYYEQRHLRGEISACEGYDHKYRSLPLLSLDDLFDVRPDLKILDESALMEARINHEHAEREALEQQRQGLLKMKQSLIAENKKRKDDLASLDQDLEKFIDAAKPIQKIFEKEH